MSNGYSRAGLAALILGSALLCSCDSTSVHGSMSVGYGTGPGWHDPWYYNNHHHHHGGHNTIIVNPPSSEPDRPSARPVPRPPSKPRPTPRGRRR